MKKTRKILGVAVLFSAPFAPATLYEAGVLVSAEYVYLGANPSKWDPGENTASFHGFTAPAGPMTPGGASWSVMPPRTRTHVLDLHVPPYETIGGYDGSLITGPGHGSEYLTFMGALDTWASVSGFTNLGSRFDTGLPFDTNQPPPPFPTYFGDIRIGSIGFSQSNILAHAFQPGAPPIFSGSLGGDVHINHDKVWVDVAAGGSGGFDLWSVVLHELGHSLGLGHTADPSTIMYPFLSPNTARRTLAPDDIAGINALYGPTTSPPVPDSGSTILFSLLVVTGMALLRRKISRH